MNDELASIAARARIHAALGDPARLAIADTLAIGDASPSEVAADLGMSSNLLAHHLNVLAAAGVIERHRSEHDRRRSYLRLRPAALAALAAPPRLAALSAPRRLATLAVPPPLAPGRVVFVCTGNSARSPLAAALWVRRSRIPAASAGTEPAARVNPRAIRTARRHGLRLDPPRTAHLEDVARDGDLLIAVCDHVHETLPPQRPRLHWSVVDPVPADTDDAFEAAYTELANRIDRLAPVFTGEGDHV